MTATLEPSTANGTPTAPTMTTTITPNATNGPGLHIEGHDLTLTAGGVGGTCACGEPFKADGRGTYPALVQKWRDHVRVAALLQAARDAARREHEARAENEEAIRDLLALGVASKTISEAIGTSRAGAPLMSASTVQRIGHTENGTAAPRRRRKA